MAFGRRKKKAAEEEPLEEDLGAEEGPVEGAEFVPDANLKPRSDVYTLLLVLSFVVFIAGCVVAGMELHEAYDVQFWGMFKKEG